MITVSKIEELRRDMDAARGRGDRIGFVPTMGYLHQGHLSLVRKARDEADTVVVSIFVNPTQFGPGEDLAEYPRDSARDIRLLEREGVDVAFIPGEGEVYPPGFSTYVDVEGLTTTLCGSSRPHHFRGVATVVSKLFNMVLPHTAYFGQKDAQQALIIRRMARDLNFPVEVKILPTVRERDGLAMSSRNTYLTPEERRIAPLLYRSLLAAEKMMEEGERRRNAIIGRIKEILQGEEKIIIDYVDMVSTRDLQPIDSLEGQVLIALAVKLGKTRLIDNIIWGQAPKVE